MEATADCNNCCEGNKGSIIKRKLEGRHSFGQSGEPTSYLGTHSSCYLKDKNETQKKRGQQVLSLVARKNSGWGGRGEGSPTN